MTLRERGVLMEVRGKELAAELGAHTVVIIASGFEGEVGTSIVGNARAELMKALWEFLESAHAGGLT